MRRRVIIERKISTLKNEEFKESCSGMVSGCESWETLELKARKS